MNDTWNVTWLLNNLILEFLIILIKQPLCPMKILKNDREKHIKIMNNKIESFKIESEEIKWEYQFLSNSPQKR